MESIANRVAFEVPALIMVVTYSRSIHTNKEENIYA